MVLIDYIVRFPALVMYNTYDRLCSAYFNWKQLFQGWGIHLYVGKFGAGKTSLMVAEAYKLCLKYPQLHILTNIKLSGFPAYTEILPLNTAQDILNAPKNTLVLIDEIGTIFNSRDFIRNSEYVFPGGRGSTKSSFCGLNVVDLIMKNENMHACILRAVANTLKDSVYSQNLSSQDKYVIIKEQ